MDRKILALVENTIGTRLLLSTRFKVLGYKAVIMSSPVAFQKRIEADSFDWILLDAAAMPLLRRRFVERVSRFRKGARIVWCGTCAPRSSLPIEATFTKPLQYGEISRFFSQWDDPQLPGTGESPSGGAGGRTATDQRGQADPQEDERREDPPAT
ncbi:MAG TPA: hypothetical protein VLM91_06790 [Candidatus Methylomirabilis sp.]|nr:hypothetical protein [Candidatus Methylomirabilis sp.]